MPIHYDAAMKKISRRAKEEGMKECKGSEGHCPLQSGRHLDG
jgi:hypothetical protein